MNKLYAIVFAGRQPARCLLVFLVFLSACGAPTDARKLTFDTTIYLNQLPVQVAVFKTPQEHRQGLMGVSHLAVHTGALFVFKPKTDVNFWMKNMLLDLDLLFFNQQGQLTHWVEAAQPCSFLTCPQFSAQDVKHVLEVNAGFIKANKLPERTHLRFSE